MYVFILVIYLSIHLFIDLFSYLSMYFVFTKLYSTRLLCTNVGNKSHQIMWFYL